MTIVKVTTIATVFVSSPKKRKERISAINVEIILHTITFLIRSFIFV